MTARRRAATRVTRNDECARSVQRCHRTHCKVMMSDMETDYDADDEQELNLSVACCVHDNNKVSESCDELRGNTARRRTAYPGEDEKQGKQNCSVAIIIAPVPTFCSPGIPTIAVTWPVRNNGICNHRSLKKNWVGFSIWWGSQCILAQNSPSFTYLCLYQLVDIYDRRGRY